MGGMFLKITPVQKTIDLDKALWGGGVALGNWYTILAVIVFLGCQ